MKIRKSSDKYKEEVEMEKEVKSFGNNLIGKKVKVVCKDNSNYELTKGKEYVGIVGKGIFALLPVIFIENDDTGESIACNLNRFDFKNAIILK